MVVFQIHSFCLSPWLKTWLLTALAESPNSPARLRVICSRALPHLPWTEMNEASPYWPPVCVLCPCPSCLWTPSSSSHLPGKLLSSLPAFPLSPTAPFVPTSLLRYPISHRAALTQASPSGLSSYLQDGVLLRPETRTAPQPASDLTQASSCTGVRETEGTAPWAGL